MKHLPDEKLTGVPKHMIQLQNKIYYPVRSVLQKMFTSNRRINISRKLQVFKNEFDFIFSVFDTIAVLFFVIAENSKTNIKVNQFHVQY